MTHSAPLSRRMAAGFLAVALGCTDDTDAPAPTDTASADDVGTDTAGSEADVGADAVADDALLPDAADPGDAADTVAPDAVPPEDVDTPDPLTLSVQAPIQPPTDPLAGTGIESCSTIDDTRCVDGARQRCAVYDTAGQAFDAQPDPTLLRAFHYDRWYERYQAPDGQTSERAFTGPVAAGTPEAEWGDPGRFAHWDGMGDSAIWTGTALTAFALRYAETGTEADRARLELKTRQLLTQFEVTGIPGYLARYHFGRVPDGTPQSTEHILRGAGEPYDHVDHAFDPAQDPAAAPDLPAFYTEGLGGTAVEPMWHGNPSIDQYTGPRVGLLLAWALLDDPGLKGRITTQLTCYLKRLQRIELRNLQKNPDALKAFQGLLGGGAFTLDEGDIDLAAVDTIVAYGLLQPNSKNADTFDRSCPGTVATTPTRVLDASAEDFLIQLFAFAGDLQSRDNLSPTAIDHLYANVRGGDALHLLGMAATAYLMTGDAQYKDFADQVLLDQMQVLEYAATVGAFRLPPWCTSFYGHHITFTPAWALFRTLAPGPVRDAVARVFETELHGKLLLGHQNAKFDLMWTDVAASLPGVDASAEQASAVAQVQSLGGNGGVLDDPRRTYTLTRAEVLAALPEGIERRCPTEDERHLCEDGFSVMGIDIPGEPITHTCSEPTDECVMADGTCAEPLASSGLPSPLRVWQDFLWQRDPFELGQDFGASAGDRQSPGVDFTESYWLARHLGAITTGSNRVLAWQNDGACD